jgi:hypothetical protein
MSILYSFRISFLLLFSSFSVGCLASPFHDQCDKATEGPIEIYYALSALSGAEKIVAAEEQNQILLRLKEEVVVDSISQLAWSYIWRPHIASLTLSLTNPNLPYHVVKQQLMSSCFELSDRHAALVRDVRRSSSIIFPFSLIRSESQKSSHLPVLISPFASGWIDTNGVSYSKIGNAIIDSNGNRIERIGDFYRSNSGRVFFPFGTSYIEATSGYTIRRFGSGYIDGEGRSVQPFGKGWVVR